jgi:AcrR family transcriptional regulator
MAAPERPVERDSDRTREAILAAAEEQFAKCGFDATTMQMIGDAAGLSRSTAAYFFGSKNDLYGAVLARVIQRARDAMLDAYQHTGDQCQRRRRGRYLCRRLAGLPRA